MAAKNDVDGYGWTARALHWIVFVVMATMLTLGLLFADMKSGDQKSRLILIHASLGTVLIALMAGRLIWRWTNVRPANPPGAPGWMARAATWLHRALYAAIFAQMTIGVFILATVDRPLPFFGLFGIAVPAPYDHELHEQLEGFHKLGWKIIAALVSVHVLAGLYHHFVRRDPVLRRMIAGGQGR